MNTWDTLLTDIAKVFKTSIKAWYGISCDVPVTVFVKPPQEAMGDIAFGCFTLAPLTKKAPHTIAIELAEKLNTSKSIQALPITTIQATGPYINITINAQAFALQLLQEILTQKHVGHTTPKKKEKIMVEFSQANTHKAFHIGHVRGTAIGESLARILEATGQTVVRANYQGDSGMHVAKWMWCYTNFHADETPKKDESWIANIYVESVKRLAENPALQTEVDEINRALDEGSNKTLQTLWKTTRKNSLDAFEPIYKDLGTHFDEYFFESTLETRGKKLVQTLLKKNIAKVSEGATIIDLEEYKLGVWVLLRSDGTVLYSTKDLVLAEEKFKQHKIDSAIYVVGNAQSLHLQQLFKTLELMKFKQAQHCYHVPVFEVRLPTGKMSSRTGDNILYSDFKKELTTHMNEELQKRYPDILEKERNHRSLVIAIAALKYSMLKQDTNRSIVFVKEEALRFEGDTGPYLLYTYARFHSILSKGGYKAKKTIKSDYNFLEEKQLLTMLATFSQEIIKSAHEHNPAIIARYAYALAKQLNEYYHTVPILKSEPEERTARLVVIDATLRVLKESLMLLGIETLEHM